MFCTGQECPPDFKEVERVAAGGDAPSGVYYTCVPCEGACPKVCSSRKVFNIESAQSLKVRRLSPTIDPPIRPAKRAPHWLPYEPAANRAPRFFLGNVVAGPSLDTEPTGSSSGAPKKKVSDWSPCYQ